MTEKRFNHAFSIGWSIDTDLTKEEWEARLETKEGLSEVCAHQLKRINRVLEDIETDAFDIWDSYENYQGEKNGYL